MGLIVKIVAIIAKIGYHNENLPLRKFRNVCEIFTMSNSEKFLTFFLKNKIE